MAFFPTTPANNDTTVVNGITYQYNTSLSAWKIVPGSVSDSVARTTANAAFIKANTAVTLDSNSNVQMTGSLNSINTFNFKNRFRNGNMIVAQRTNTATVTAGTAVPTQSTGYPCVDGWFIYSTGANITTAQVAGTGNVLKRLQITGAASVTAIGVGQRIEDYECFDLAGSTCTLSADISNSLLTTVTWTAYYANTTNTFGTVGTPTKTQIATGTWTVSSTITNYSAQISVPSAATTGIEVIFTVGAQTSGTWVLGNIQLEKGSQATYYDFKPHHMEMNRCCRYFVNLSGTTNNYQPLCFGSTYSSTMGSWLIHVPVPMRVIPLLNYSGTFVAQNLGINLSNFAGPYSHIGTIVEGDFTLGSSSSAGNYAIIRWNNIAPASRSFNFSAEIP